MNLGLSGPMKGRRADAEKARDESAGVEHRDMELKEFLGNWGGIVACELPWAASQHVVERRSKSLGAS